MARAKSSPAEGELLSHSGERKGSDLALEITIVQLGRLIPQDCESLLAVQTLSLLRCGHRHFAGEGSKGWSASGKGTACS